MMATFSPAAATLLEEAAGGRGAQDWLQHSPLPEEDAVSLPANLRVAAWRGARRSVRLERESDLLTREPAGRDRRRDVAEKRARSVGLTAAPWPRAMAGPVACHSTRKSTSAGASFGPKNWKVSMNRGRRGRFISRRTIRAGRRRPRHTHPRTRGCPFRFGAGRPPAFSPRLRRRGEGRAVRARRGAVRGRR